MHRRGWIWISTYRDCILLENCNYCSLIKKTCEKLPNCIIARESQLHNKLSFCCHVRWKTICSSKIWLYWQLNQLHNFFSLQSQKDLFFSRKGMTVRKGFSLVTCQKKKRLNFFICFSFSSPHRNINNTHGMTLFFGEKRSDRVLHMTKIFLICQVSDDEFIFIFFVYLVNTIAIATVVSQLKDVQTLELYRRFKEYSIYDYLYTSFCSFFFDN